MSDSGVGRVLVASLHQAIADVLPTRLAFYEGWLNAEGLRDGTIGLAPLYAVLSFLRQEEGSTYAEVTSQAGRYAAEWTVESMSPLGRSAIRALPMPIRRRLVLNRARTFVRMSYEGSRARWRMRKGTARLTVTASVFCSVREPVAHPLCRYYAAGVQRMLQMFGIDTVVRLETCRAAGGDTCSFIVPFVAEEPIAHEAEAA